MAGESNDRENMPGMELPEEDRDNIKDETIAISEDLEKTPAAKPVRKVPIDLRTLDQDMFRGALQSAAKHNRLMTENTPAEERDSEDEAEGYITYVSPATAEVMHRMSQQGKQKSSGKEQQLAGHELDKERRAQGTVLDDLDKDVLNALPSDDSGASSPASESVTELSLRDKNSKFTFSPNPVYIDERCEAGFGSPVTIVSSEATQEEEEPVKPWSIPAVVDEGGPKVAFPAAKQGTPDSKRALEYGIVEKNPEKDRIKQKPSSRKGLWQALLLLLVFLGGYGIGHVRQTQPASAALHSLLELPVVHRLAERFGWSDDSSNPASPLSRAALATRELKTWATRSAVAGSEYIQCSPREKNIKCYVKDVLKRLGEVSHKVGNGMTDSKRAAGSTITERDEDLGLSGIVNSLESSQHSAQSLDQQPSSDQVNIPKKMGDKLPQKAKEILQGHTSWLSQKGSDPGSQIAENAGSALDRAEHQAKDAASHIEPSLPESSLERNHLEKKTRSLLQKLWMNLGSVRISDMMSPKIVWPVAMLLSLLTAARYAPVLIISTIMGAADTDFAGPGSSPRESARGRKARAAQMRAAQAPTAMKNEAPSVKEEPESSPEKEVFHSPEPKVKPVRHRIVRQAISPTAGPQGSPAPARREAVSTWMPSRTTPTRITRVESSPSRLSYRELRERTVVLAEGKQVGDFSPEAKIPDTMTEPRMTRLRRGQS